MKRGLIPAVLLAVHAIGAAPPPAAADGDPWEPFNRSIFWFNDQLDRFVLEPAAIGWDAVLPDQVQLSLRGVSDNLLVLPITFLNDVLQGKIDEAGLDLARFGINTTVGLLGIWDAARRLGIEANDEDFGQTLGYWGVPAGPYLVLPFFGPSNPRDAIGLLGDAAPRSGVTWGFGIPFYVTASITTVDIVNRRSLLIETIREEREAALDWYVFVRNAYVQNREQLVHDRAEPPRDEEPADLYDLGDEEDDLYYLDEEADE